MLFSLLVANYNNGHFFRDCYSSILAQTYTHWEVVIVDDASRDDSVSVIQNLIKGDKRFKLYKNSTNRGCGYTKHRCASQATGSILGYLDPDDALKPTALETMILAHKQNPDASIITSRHELVDLDLNFLYESQYGSSLPVEKSYLTYGNGALTAFATFKKANYNDTTGVDPIMKRAVDQDLYYKLEEQGSHLFIDEVLYRYRIHKNSISNNENLFKAQYWHFYAIINAYKRRKKLNLSISNHSKDYIKKLQSNYYFGRFEKLKHTRKKCAKLYLLYRSIIVFPLHRTTLKLKSLILVLIGKI
jgi:glycosyltransferase involved in cell wall biosynthesis